MSTRARSSRPAASSKSSRPSTRIARRRAIPLPELLDCPRCNSRLALTHDLQRTTHFSYYRCDWGHGRLTPFVQFLLEKNFVRPMSGSELATLKARVRSVQCSNCGAPIDLQHDTVCPYCRSPLAILDPEAVNKALRELTTAEVQRKTIDVDRLADALTMRAPGIGGLNRSQTVGHRRRACRRSGRRGHDHRRRAAALTAPLRRDAGRISSQAMRAGIKSRFRLELTRSECISA